MATILPALGSRLDGARAKVRRASEHIGALKRAVKRFTDSDPCEVGARPSEGIIVQTALSVPTPSRSPSGLAIPSGRRMLAKTVAVEITLTPRPDTAFPALRWGTIIG